MTRTLATLCASTALVAAAPALGQSDATTGSQDMAGGMTICDHAFYPGDTNTDGTLTEEELAEKRDAEFEQLDANADGTITREEFKNCVGEGEQAALDAAQENLESGDYALADWADFADANTTLSIEDYMEAAETAWDEADEAMITAYTAGQNTADMTEERFAATAVQQFHALDANGDGIVTEEEYESRDRAARFDEAALERRFEAHDANDDGEISPQEYRGAGLWSTDTAEGAEGIPVYIYYIEMY